MMVRMFLAKRVSRPATTVEIKIFSARSIQGSRMSISRAKTVTVKKLHARTTPSPASIITVKTSRVRASPDPAT